MLLRIMLGFFYSFSETSVHSFAMQNVFVLLLWPTHPVGPDWSRGRSLCKDQPVELAGLISHIAWKTLEIQLDALPLLWLLCWAAQTSTMPVPEWGPLLLSPPSSGRALSAHGLAALAQQCSVCVVCVGVIVLHLCARGYSQLLVERKNISVPGEGWKSCGQFCSCKPVYVISGLEFRMSFTKIFSLLNQMIF